MGGASMAYDNGTAAVMNNPATLGLMAEGSQIDVAVGLLAPSITSKMTGMPSADSSATAFYMPAMGYARKTGKLTYGVGVFSQGGMGTEYSANSFMAGGTGKTVRSEVGVGRFIFPLAYQVNDDITVGGSLDYVWAGMDLQMAMDGAQMGAMMAPGGSGSGVITADAGTAAALGGAMAGMGHAVGYFDFSNNSKFSGKAQGQGFAGKIGFTYKINQALTVGGTYHTKTALGDLNASGVSLSLIDITNGTTVPMAGSISVKNFQWPDTYGVGIAYQANDKLLLVADYKRIGWAAVMQNFHMVFSPNAGGYVDATLYQKWEDQNVVELGGAYKTSDALTLRAGINVANNPVPDKYMNPLFPAIGKNHVTMGVGYALSKSSTLNFDYAYMIKNTVTGGSGVTVDFGGYSAQFLYSHKY
jgi:long-chain fatty acid transport protein